MSSTVDDRDLDAAASPEAARARAAEAIGSLAKRSRGLGAKLQKGGTASAAYLRAGLAQSGSGLKTAGHGLKTAGGAIATRTRSATKASADFTANRLAPWVASRSRSAAQTTKAGFTAVETFTVETAVPRTMDTLKRGGTGSWRFMSGTAAPWLASAARATRDRLRPSALNADYRRALTLLHERALDRGVESLLFVGTRQPVDAAERQAISQEPGEALHPTPVHVFRWAMEAIPEPLDHFTFVDLGAGRGRTLLLAAGHDFEKVIGIESAETLHDDCQMNIAQYPRSRMKCRDVECIHADVMVAPLPDDKTVYYLFQPFEERVLRIVVERIVASYKRQPRRLYLVCVGLTSVPPVEASEVFLKVPLPRALRAKLAALSPYPVTVYRSIA